MISGRANAPSLRTASAPAQQLALNLSNPPGTPDLHDLAVAAVDFDPESGSQRIFSGSPYNLLVAVENKGNHPEGPVTVSLQLLAKDSGRLLMAAQRTLRMLSAGDVTVVRFPGRASTPPLGVYLLNAQVQAPPRDANPTNNKRVLELRANRTN